MQRYARRHVAATGRGPYTRRVLRTVIATRYVTPLREGGSVPALVEADDDGLYVVKLLGAGHGRKALVAELVAGELARAPRAARPRPRARRARCRALEGRARRRDPGPARAERRARTSASTSCPARSPSPRRRGRSPTRTSPRTSCGSTRYTTNVDRTARNPNLIVWHRRPYLIDHGSALYVHHTWAEPDAHARRPFPQVRDHVLLPFASPIADADARLAPRIDRGCSTAIVASIPDDWLPAGAGAARPGRPSRGLRRLPAARLEAPRAFVEEADRARAA